jgi:hypothetical protein
MVLPTIATKNTFVIIKSVMLLFLYSVSPSVAFPSEVVPTTRMDKVHICGYYELLVNVYVWYIGMSACTYMYSHALQEQKKRMKK